eukprot:3217877-Rhodomonas_salina.2
MGPVAHERVLLSSAAGVRYTLLSSVIEFRSFAWSSSPDTDPGKRAGISVGSFRKAPRSAQTLTFAATDTPTAPGAGREEPCDRVGSAGQHDAADAGPSSYGEEIP